MPSDTLVTFTDKLEIFEWNYKVGSIR